MGLVKPVWPAFQSGHPLAKGLIGAWPFYEGAGGTVNDLSGFGNLGTITSGQAWIGGEFGSALSFSGSSQKVQIANSPSLNPSFVTIAALLCSTSASGAQFVVNKNFDGSTVPYSLCIGGAPDPNTIGMAFYAPGWRKSGITTDIRGDNKWHLVVGTYDQANLKYYIDGKLDSSAAETTAMPTSNTQPLYIGEYVNDFAFFTGNISLVLLWSRALSSVEVAQLYFDPFAIFRSRTRFAQFVSAAAPPAACAPTRSLLGIGCGIQAARAMIRNRVVGRREIVAELLGVNDE